MSHIPFAAPTSTDSVRVSPSDAGNTTALRTRPTLRKFCVKTKLCPLNQRGVCKWGENCRFAHDPSEIQVAPDLSRTKLCPKLLRTGCCPRGEACTFAHSAAELRRVERFEEEEEAATSALHQNLNQPQQSSLPRESESSCPSQCNVEARVAQCMRREDTQVTKNVAPASSAKLLTVPATVQGPHEAPQSVSALQQRRRVTAQNPLPNLLVPPRVYPHAARVKPDSLAMGMPVDASEAAEAMHPVAKDTAVAANSMEADITVHSPVAATSLHNAQLVKSYLRFAEASGAMTMQDMALYLTKIFGTMFKSRPEVQRRVDVTPQVLAQSVVEEAWDHADLCKDSRMTFNEFARWCSAENSMGSLVVPRIVVTACEGDNTKAECASPLGSEALSRRSTDVGINTPLSTRSFDFSSAPASSCGSPMPWPSSPMGPW